MAHKLILNKGSEEQVREFADIEEAFDAAMPWIMKGYIARITDKQGVVKYTQALVNGQIGTYPGDSMDQAAGAGVPGWGQSPAPAMPTAPPPPPAPGPRKPWWRFW